MHTIATSVTKKRKIITCFCPSPNLASTYIRTSLENNDTMHDPNGNKSITTRHLYIFYDQHKKLTFIFFFSALAILNLFVWSILDFNYLD